MARNQFHYYFRMHTFQHVTVTKIDPITGDPVLDRVVREPLIYQVKGNLIGGRGVCTCPAGQNGYRPGPCKHEAWVQRWLAIQKADPAVGVIYYDSETDRFYHLAGLETDNLEALVERQEQLEPNDRGDEGHDHTDGV